MSWEGCYGKYTKCRVSTFLLVVVGTSLNFAEGNVCQKVSAVACCRAVVKSRNGITWWS